MVNETHICTKNLVHSFVQKINKTEKFYLLGMTRYWT